MAFAAQPVALATQRSARSRLCWVRAVTCCCVFALSVPGVIGAAASSPVVAYGRLVEALRLAPNSVQREFAQLALGELDTSHRVEAARSQAGGDRRGRWAASVESYNAGLRSLTAGITPDTIISLHIGADGRTQLLVDDAVVIISSPRASQQSQLEQRIVERFCARYLCHQLIVENLAAPDVDTRGVTFGFDITEDAGLSCNSGDGLEFLFYVRDQIDERRRWCQQIVAELRMLGWALGEQIDAGVPIEWDQFTIDVTAVQADGGSVPGNTVRLNGAGDSLVLPLPYCAAAPRLMRRLVPWLATRSEGLGHQGIMLIITNTEALIDS